MKNILLSSAAIVAFAGAAAAEVSFGGDATLGYNDDVEDGVYGELNLDASATAELNNGWTAGASLTLEFQDFLNGFVSGSSDIEASEDFTVYIESDMGGLYYGDYDSAVEQLTIGVEGLEDGMNDYEDYNNLVIKGSFGGFEAAVSASIDNGGDPFQETAVIKGTFGTVEATLGHDKDADATAVAIATEFGAASVELGFADVAGDTRYGIEVGYPVGPVALTVWYSENDSANDDYGIKAVYEDGPLSVTGKVHKDGTTEYDLEGTYDLGNGLVIAAGTISDEGDYIAAAYDLGGGATFLASYADADSAGYDEVGEAYDDDFELKDGLTLEVSLSF